jgi:hypothetical protein
MVNPVELANHFTFIGVALMLLAVIHITFPKYFSWADELKSVSLMNRQMMYVHTFFIALTVFLMGLLCVTSVHDLQYTALGKRITFGLGIFWVIRLLIQFFGYSPKLWRGKRFETAVHIISSVFWTYMSIVFFAASLW